jgi:hypothetical protein
MDSAFIVKQRDMCYRSDHDAFLFFDIFFSGDVSVLKMAVK